MLPLLIECHSIFYRNIPQSIVELTDNNLRKEIRRTAQEEHMRVNGNLIRRYEECMNAEWIPLSPPPITRLELIIK